MKRSRWPILVILAMVLTLLLSADMGLAASPSYREFRIAAREESLSYQFWDSAVESLVYSFGVCDSSGTVWWGIGVDFDEGDQGNTLWWTPNDPGYVEITNFLTNGTPNLVRREVSERVTGNGAGTPGVLEAEYFGDQVGPNGIDLAGFQISRIGVNFDSIRIEPNYPNHTTDWEVHGTVIFAQEATKDACKNGGWKHLERMNGGSFNNQGDCIQYVNTGR